MIVEEIIDKLKLLKAEIEWDYSLEYQIVLDEVIKRLEYISYDKFLEEVDKVKFNIPGSEANIVFMGDLRRIVTELKEKIK